LHLCARAQGVYKQMVEVFRSLGVEAVPGVGSPFNPEVHDAIMREENDDVPDGTVLKEFRRGFRLGDQLMRPAMVQVSLCAV
jgi:molecular chaperone GrpE